MTKKDKECVAPISVVCPTYNSALFVNRMFAAITKQTTPPSEVCVCDDGSTDGTISLLQELIKNYKGPTKFTILQSSHQGPGAARNQAIKIVREPWVAFLDSDDEWEKTKISAVMKSISKHPDANFLCHSEYRINFSGQKSESLYYQKYRHEQSLSKQLYKGNLFSTSAVVCKTSLLQERGLFSETYLSAQDYELWLRLAPFIKLVFMPDILGSYIERQGNITSQKFLMRLKNEVKIAWCYRNYVNGTVLIYRLLRIMGSFLFQASQYFRKRSV